MKLKTWDGKCDIFQYDKSDINYWKMMINSNGDIYYYTMESPRKLNLYCSASKLHRHIVDLYRRGVSTVKKISQ